MTIYVDALVQYGPDFYRGPSAQQARRVGARCGHRWCHLFGEVRDSPELHALARRIGLRPEWFQRDHYDLTPGRRQRAVELGAVEVNRQQAVEIWARWRDQRSGGTS